jgi:hypothetical protein
MFHNESPAPDCSSGLSPSPSNKFLVCTVGEGWGEGRLLALTDKHDSHRRGNAPILLIIKPFSLILLPELNKIFCDLAADFHRWSIFIRVYSGN